MCYDGEECGGKLMDVQGYSDVGGCGGGMWRFREGFGRIWGM